MATLEDSPISTASPQGTTLPEYDTHSSPVSQSSTEHTHSQGLHPVTKLAPISGASPGAKFKQRINKIKFKRKPSVVKEHSLDSSSQLDIPIDTRDSDVNMTSDATRDDTSLDDVMNEYQAFAREASEEGLPSDPIPPPLAEPTNTLDMSVYIDNVLGIKIIGSDPLKPNISLSHPLLKVTLYCDKTCTHLKKSEKSRAVSSFYETANETVDYILPQLTAPAVVNTSNNFTPRWEEELIFNEDLCYLLSYQSLVLLFELMEFKEKFLPPSLPKRQGWRHIAWAFLKLRGANNRVNLQQRLRLQFYRYSNKQYAGSRDNPGFQAWYHGYRTKYPSTLHLTVRPVRMEGTMASLRSYAPNQPETAATRQTVDNSTFHKQPSCWNRTEGQTCMVPNTSLLSSPLAGYGASVLKFSPDGAHLAVAVVVGELSEVWVYAVPSCEEVMVLKGHHGLVYDLSWSSSSLLLMTASQDTTARVWHLPDTENGPSSYKLLPHPSYIYACSFHPFSDIILLTAGFDRVIRVWGIAALGVNSSQIMREFRSHSGYINCLTFDPTGMRMFSGDSEGCVYIWQVSLSRSGSSPSAEEVETWRELDKIHLKEITGVGIRSILSVGKRLVLHTSDGALRLIDIRKQAVLTRYPIHSPETHPLSRCAVSPCGSNLYLGTATDLSVWRIDTGTEIHSFSLQQLTLPSARIVCTDYHPLDHILAMCTYGTSGSLLVSKYTPPLDNSHVSLTQACLAKSIPGDTLSDTAMVLLREEVRHKLNSICLDPPLPSPDTSRPLSTTWDSLGSLTTPILRDRIFTHESIIEENLPADYESVSSRSEIVESTLTLEMLERPPLPARDHTPIYSTSEMEEGDFEAGERGKRSLARRRRSLHKQRSAKTQSVPTE